MEWGGMVGGMYDVDGVCVDWDWDTKKFSEQYGSDFYFPEIEFWFETPDRLRQCVNDCRQDWLTILGVDDE
jgi:hypothetical protein